MTWLPKWHSGKESACQCRRCGFSPWVRKMPWRRKWQPTPVFLPGNFHGQRSPVGLKSMGIAKSQTQLRNRALETLVWEGGWASRILRKLLRKQWWSWGDTRRWGSHLLGRGKEQPRCQAQDTPHACKQPPTIHSSGARPAVQEGTACSVKWNEKGFWRLMGCGERFQVR